MAWSPTAVQTEGLFVTESPIPDKVLINVPSVAESDNSEGDIVNTMALLPKNTVVRISGNNRTKASLVGQKAIVRRSIGLGGWHWLVLPTGEEVKLQRNALFVLEYPAHHESESSASDADRQKRVDTVLEYDNGIHFSCGSSPLQYPYNSGMQRSQIRRHRSSYSNGGEGADVRKSSLRTSSVIPRANLSKLSTVSLRKYITIHRLSLLGQGREDLLAAAVEHFDQKMEVTEDEVIRRFSAAAKRHVEGLPQMLHA